VPLYALSRIGFLKAPEVNLVDHLTKQQRSELMSRIRSKNTRPEKATRSLLNSLGYRFRLHVKIPGTPDIVFTKRREAIFVHGCFWHGHEGCSKWRLPKSRTAYWSEKIASNRLRDSRKLRDAENEGWECLIIWECEVPHLLDNPEYLTEFIGPQRIDEVCLRSVILRTAS
jgi:DNA mismatch endonuclease (patch repair protein)